MHALKIKILDPRLGTTFPLPEYQTSGSAAMDLRALIPEPSATLAPGASLLVPTGFALHLEDPNYAALVLPRSGLGHRHGLVLGNLVGLIDSDYQGELKISLWNRSAEPYVLQCGARVAQLLIVPIARPSLEIVTAFAASDRGAGGFGHTGDA